MAANHSFKKFFTTFFSFFFVFILWISPTCALKDDSYHESGHQTTLERWTEGGERVGDIPDLEKTNHDDTAPQLPPRSTTTTTITITTITISTTLITPPPSLLFLKRQNPGPDDKDNAIADLQFQITSLSSALSLLSSGSQSLSQASQQTSIQLSQSLQQASQSLIQASQRLSQTEQSLASARITQQAAEQASRAATQRVEEMSRQMSEMSRSMSQSAREDVRRVSQSAEEAVGRVRESAAAAVAGSNKGVDGIGNGGQGMDVPVLVGAVVGGVVGSSVVTGVVVFMFMRRRKRGPERGEKEVGGEVIYVGPRGSHGSGDGRDIVALRGNSINTRRTGTLEEDGKSYPGGGPVIWVASTDTASVAGSRTRVATSPSTYSTSAINMKISNYEDESVYNNGENGGPPPSSQGGSLMEGRTALSPPPPAIPPRARSRSRPAPGAVTQTTAPPPGFTFAAENPVPPAPAPAASTLLSPFPPRPKSVRLGVGTGPVKRQSSSDGSNGVGCAVSYDYPPVPVPPPPVRSAPGPPAPKWAPPTIPRYGDDAKPLASAPGPGTDSGSRSGFKLDNPLPSAVKDARKSNSRGGARDTRLSIFPGARPSPTPSTQGWSSSPLSSPAASTPPVPERVDVGVDRHRRGGSESTEETKERGRPAQNQERQSQLPSTSTNGGQTTSPAPTLEAWLKRGMSSTRVPVRTTGNVGPEAALPRSASTSNIRRQSYTARLREQAREHHLLDVNADDGTGGRGEDWPIRQS